MNRIRIRDLLKLAPAILLPLAMGFGAIAKFAEGEYLVFGVFVLYFLVFGAMGIGFVNLYRRSKRTSIQEIGRQAIYSETCGARIGSMNYTIPFGQVNVYDGLLVVKAYDGVEFCPQDIWNIKTLSRFGYAGIQIQHTRKDIPLPIIVWTWNPVLLRDAIEKGLHLKDMPQYGIEPIVEGLTEHERQERKKYPWLQ